MKYCGFIFARGGSKGIKNKMKAIIIIIYGSKCKYQNHWGLMFSFDITSLHYLRTESTSCRRASCLVNRAPIFSKQISLKATCHNKKTNKTIRPNRTNKTNQLNKTNKTNKTNQLRFTIYTRYRIQNA